MKRIQPIGYSLLAVVAVLAIGREIPARMMEATPAKLATPIAPHHASRAQIASAYGKLPLSFEANRGQAGPGVKYLSRGGRHTLLLTEDGAVLTLRAGQPSMDALLAPSRLRDGRSPIVDRESPVAAPVSDTVLRLRLVGARAGASVTGDDELPGKTNYLIGNDRAKWHTNVPTYAKVTYKGVYPGVDLVYYGNQGGQLEYDFVVAPGADPGAIRLNLETGLASRMRLDATGDLIVHAAAGDIRLQRPVVYQRDAGGRKRFVGGRYVRGGRSFGTTRSSSTVSFELASYDHSRSLIIDPVLAYSTFLGNSDESSAIALDASGNAYIGGDGFVAKLNAAGNALIYYTNMAGNVKGIALDTHRNAYVTGYTGDDGFPTTPGAVQTARGGRMDAFVSKLDATGSSLIYSTLLGGDWYEFGVGIAVDAAENAYIIATGSAWGYGGTSAWPTTPGAFMETVQCCGNHVAVTKLNATGTALVYSTFLGGNHNDDIHGLAVDAAGNAYVTGDTYSSSFPTTPGAFQTVNAFATQSAYVTKLNAAGSALVYSTYLSGSDSDIGYALTVDAAGNAYVAGATYSADFPTTPGAYQTDLRGGTNAFVTKVNPTGTALLYSTYLGGSINDQPYGIAVDASGDAYLTGLTFSADFPTTPGASQTVKRGTYNAFVSELNPTGDALLLSTFLGGGASDVGAAIAVDGAANVFVAGSTTSADFPVTVGAYQTSADHSGSNPFVVKIGGDNQAPNVLCGAADGAWHATDVTIGCTAFDAGSGLLNAGDASFTLTTHVASGTETAGASTDSRTVCDAAHNCVTVGPIGGNMIDKRTPTISISAPTNQTYALNQNVTAAFTCGDGGSGISTCMGTVANGAVLATTTVGSHAFSVSAMDAVGNNATSQVIYTVAYNQCVLFDQTKSYKSGSTIPIKLQLCDAAGGNVSDASVPVVATGVYLVSNSAPGPLGDSGDANPDNQFRFAGGGYIYNLSLKGFAQGTYAMTFTAGNDPTTHTVQFQVK